MAKKKKVSYVVPEDVAGADHMVYQLGNAMRAAAALELEAQSKVADVMVGYASRIAEYKREADNLLLGIQAFCEAHRTELLQPGSKTSVFANGEVSWKTRPPSVEFKKGLKVEDVVAALKAAGLEIFVRVKEEVDKEAILSTSESQEKIKDVPALYIRKDVEDFIVAPHAPKIDVPATDS